MINITDLKEDDIGRKVIYQSHPLSKKEEGRITSFNKTWVFVDYDNTGRGQPTPPKQLIFID